MFRDLFTFGGGDPLDTFAYQFADIKLLTSIGEHAPGDEFNCAAIDFEKATLTLFHGAQEWKYPLTLQVGQLLP